MSFEIIRKSELNTTKWTGGTTTQLTIFPKEATYAARNFVFRISTAKVEDQTSEFTSLPGISRVIMILEGEIVLNHENEYSKNLKKFETDFFKGEWKTTGIGQVIDFNLMTSDKAVGSIEGIFLQKKYTIDFEVSNQVLGLYLHKGSLSINNLNDEPINLEEGDFILLFKEVNQAIFNLKAIENCELIITKIDIQ